jgi:NAD(P)-dependent dehydrogenase (short-subunit alcohol dehydrogenase family)
MLNSVHELSNKVAVITGAASGIGRQMARRLAKEGMRLMLADLDQGRLADLARELATVGGQVATQAVDVARADDVEALAARTYQVFGAAHILCNNAGVLPPGVPTWSGNLATWNWTLGVNFYGVLHGIQAFVPRMLDAGHEAHIVNTASLAGLTTRPLMSAYNVSKHAVVALSECLYAELKLTTDRIHVSVLCPPWARTRLADNAREDAESAFGFHEAVMQVVEEGVEPEEIVETMLVAVRDNRFWVLTHPQYDSGIRDRFESMLARTNPSVRDLRKLSIPLR